MRLSYTSGGGGGGGVPDAHAASHAPGGSDPVTANPAAHAADHESGGDDELDPNDLPFSYVPATLKNWNDVAPQTLHDALDRLSEGLVVQFPTPEYEVGDSLFPKSLPGAVLWLRADRGITYGGGDPQRVVGWKDQITGANFTNAADNTSNPTVVANAIATGAGNFQAIRFQRANSQYLSELDPTKIPFPAGLYPAHFCALVRPLTVVQGNANVQSILGVSGGNAASAAAGLEFGLGSFGDAQPVAAAVRSIQTGGAANVLHTGELNQFMSANLWQAIESGAPGSAGGSYSRTGNEVLLSSGGTTHKVIGDALNAMTIGAYLYTQIYTEFADADVIELVAFDETPTEDTTNALRDHWEAYYGFVLPNADLP